LRTGEVIAVHRVLVGIVVLLVGLAQQAPAIAATAASGKALGVNPAAQAELDNETRTLQVGADIFLGDKVVTGPKGQVQIKFADATELVVGPRSSLVIQDYLIRNDGSAGKLAVNMLAGSFRFVTGTAAKDRYLITTPSGTIGVRGTAFDVYVDAAGKSFVVMYHGTTRICSNDGTCENLSGLCKLGEIDADEAAIVGNTQEIRGDARKTLRAEFIYAVNQSPLLSAFRLPRALDCLNSPEQGTPVESINSGGTSQPQRGRGVFGTGG
jgi:hypothetical protein